MSERKQPGFGTRAAHAGAPSAPPEFTPTVAPVYASTTYLYPAAEMDAIFGGQRDGYVYGRHGNPTVAAFEEAIADLEGGVGAAAFASGMAALHGALFAGGLRAGDRVLAADQLYGATHSLVETVLPELGIQCGRVDAGDADTVAAALAVEPACVLLVEAISNPLLQVVDVPALAAACAAHGTLLVVDATFASPYLLRPLEHGAGLVVHSATKYLSGHGDVTAGVAVARDEALVRAMRDRRRLLGATLDPMAAWLGHRGLKTLALRLERQCANAARVAAWLEANPRVARVYYPGLPSHPQHATAARLFRPGAFGGMLSFEIAGARLPEAYRFLDSLRLCLPATTLGDIYTLALSPAMSSHRALTPEARAAIGIRDNLIRLSVGIEDVDDIVADLNQALDTQPFSVHPGR